MPGATAPAPTFLFAHPWPRYTAAFAPMIRSRLHGGRPFFLAHAVTFGGNSRCPTCSYGKLTPRMQEDLPTEAVYRRLDDASAAGMRGDSDAFSLAPRNLFARAAEGRALLHQAHGEALHA